MDSFDSPRLSLDNPRIARIVGKLSRHPERFAEWEGILETLSDKEAKAKMSAALNAAKNKHTESLLALEQQKLGLKSKANDMSLYLKEKTLKSENDWKPGAVLGGIDILSKGYFGGKAAERKKLQADKINKLSLLFGDEVA